jgi:hypothetical protein
MNRALGTVCVLLVVCLLLPTAASYAMQAVPVLVGLIVVLAALRLLLPPRSRRRS